MSAAAALSLKDEITLSLAVLGAALGIMNTWNTMSQRRVKLRVRPGTAFNTQNGARAVFIEAVNLSAFPVTVDEVGFAPRLTRGKSPRRHLIPEPMVLDGKPWPRRLEPREAVTAFMQLPELSGARRDFYKAYVRTSCGEIAFGRSPALRQLRES